MACSEEGRLPDGMPLAEAFARLREADADIVGANCLNGPHAMLRLFKRLPAEGLLSAFPNAGYPKYHDGRYLYYTTPEYFAEAARGLAAEGARLIGGCCGIGPPHIAAMVEALRELTPVTAKIVVREPVPESGLVEAGRHFPAGAPNHPGTDAEGKTVVMTELDPPKTLDLEKYFAGAKALTEAGSDVITLADNSLAILRVSNLAVGAMLKQRHNINPLLHVSCRDRNLLGLQSELHGHVGAGDPSCAAAHGRPRESRRSSRRGVGV